MLHSPQFDQRQRGSSTTFQKIKIASRPCHINSVTHFVRGADPCQIKTVAGSLALSAHSGAGSPEINLWLIHSMTVLKAQTLLDQSQTYITEYLNSFHR